MSGQIRATESPLQLATHFPTSTQIYAESELTSLAILDSFWQRFLPLFGEEGNPFSLEKGLATILPDGLHPYEAASIYGNRVALGIADFELATSSQLLALEIVDPITARQLLEEAFAPELAGGSLRRIVQQNGNVRYLPESTLLGISYELRSNALLIASAAKAMRNEGEPSLLENERLLAAHDNLPPAEYETLLLVDGEALLLRALGEALVNPTLAEILPSLGRNWLTLITALGDGAIGLRRVSENQQYEIILAIRPIPNTTATFPRIEFTTVPQDEVTIDPTSQIPENTALALLGENLGTDVDQLVATIAAWAGWLTAADALPTDLGWLPTLDILLPLALRALTGLDLEEDLLSWMRGDYLLILEEQPPNFTLVSHSTDPVLTKITFENLRNSLDFYDPETDVFRPPLALPLAWVNRELALQLLIADKVAILKHVSAPVPATAPANTVNINTNVSLLTHRLPGSQLLLYFDAMHLANWLEAFDPALARIDALGRNAFALRWQDGLFTVQWLFSIE